MENNNGDYKESIVELTAKAEVYIEIIEDSTANSKAVIKSLKEITE